MQYFEPAKWVAKLRATKTDDNLIVLDTDMTAGHGGASGRFDSLRDVARCTAFLLTVATTARDRRRSSLAVPWPLVSGAARAGPRPRRARAAGRARARCA